MTAAHKVNAEETLKARVLNPEVKEQRRGAVTVKSVAVVELVLYM